MSEVNTEDITWRDLAACKQLSTGNAEEDMFYDAYEEGKGDIRQIVDSICIGCPVATICDEYAVQNKLEGVWGGYYHKPNGQPDPAKNAHKTEEQWELLEAKLNKKLRR